MDSERKRASIKEIFQSIRGFFRRVLRYQTLHETYAFSFSKLENNIRRFQDTFEAVLGVGKWAKTFSQGLTHYNYRLIDEDILGKLTRHS